MSGNDDWPIRGQHRPNMTNQRPVFWGVIESDDGSLSADMSVSYLCSLTALMLAPWVIGPMRLEVFVRQKMTTRQQPIRGHENRQLTRVMGSECHLMDEIVPLFCQLKQYLMLFAFNDGGNFHKITQGYFAFTLWGACAQSVPLQTIQVWGRINLNGKGWAGSIIFKFTR